MELDERKVKHWVKIIESKFDDFDNSVCLSNLEICDKDIPYIVEAATILPPNFKMDLSHNRITNEGVLFLFNYLSNSDEHADFYLIQHDYIFDFNFVDPKKLENDIGAEGVVVCYPINGDIWVHLRAFSGFYICDTTKKGHPIGLQGVDFEFLPKCDDKKHDFYASICSVTLYKDLTNEDLETYDLGNLFTFLSELPNLTSFSFYLDPKSQTNVDHICSFISRNTKLKSIVAGKNCFPFSQGFDAIAQSIHDGHTHLTEIDLGGICCNTEEDGIFEENPYPNVFFIVKRNIEILPQTKRVCCLLLSPQIYKHLNIPKDVMIYICKLAHKVSFKEQEYFKQDSKAFEDILKFSVY